MRNLLLLVLTAVSSLITPLAQADFSPFGISKGPLPNLVTDPQTVTMSGLSAGAFFAIQYGMAHSSEVMGVASFAGGVYHCANGNMLDADACAQDPSTVDVQKEISFAQAHGEDGSIEPITHVQGQKVFVYQGSVDAVVNPGSANKLVQFYQSLGAHVAAKTNLASGHGIPTQSFGGLCAASDAPWVLNCGYDAAGALLNYFYGNLAPKAAMKNSNLTTFDQSEFSTFGDALNSTGYVYIPDSCKITTNHCRLHVAFHGCMQTPAMVADAFVAHTGLNDWAESNNIVVLYPSVDGADLTGCWDWYGYTGPDYDLASAKQITAVRAMISRLQGN